MRNITEVESIKVAMAAGLPMSEVGLLVQTPEGLRALCGGGRVEWTGGLINIMRESGLESRGWWLFHHDGHWRVCQSGQRVFRGYMTRDGWIDEVVIPADKSLAVLTRGDGYSLSLMVVYPKAS
jgi:hypothetical protein